MVTIPYLSTPKPLVSVVRLHGVIAAGGGRFSGGTINDAAFAPLLQKAFTRGKPKAVALSINSPGGSPVQSSLVAARIRRLADEHKVPVYAFCEDVAASGGYWLAAEADHIYADENSIVGSIGVISAGFGFQDLIARYGIERRVHTAGEDKSMLDPFRAERDEDITRLKHIQKNIHDSFIAHVKRGRGDRLTRDDLFTGDVWTGGDAVGLGLIDGIGHLVPKMKEIYGKDTRFAVASPRRSLYQRLGAPNAGSAISDVEDRMLWQRFGL